MPKLQVSMMCITHPVQSLVTSRLLALSSQTNKDQTPLSGWATHILNARYSIFQEQKNIALLSALPKCQGDWCRTHSELNG